MFGTANRRLPLRRQGGRQESRAASQIGGGDRRAVEGPSAVYAGHLSVHPDIRAHFHKLGHVAEAVFKDRLYKDRRPPGPQGRRGPLHVRLGEDGPSGGKRR